MNCEEETKRGAQQERNIWIHILASIFSLAPIYDCLKQERADQFHHADMSREFGTCFCRADFKVAGKRAPSIIK